MRTVQEDVLKQQLGQMVKDWGYTKILDELVSLVQESRDDAIKEGDEDGAFAYDGLQAQLHIASEGFGL